MSTTAVFGTVVTGALPSETTRKVLTKTSLWRRLAAHFYDRLLASFEERWLRRQRCELLRSCSGDVLEIGGGTGANLFCYPDGVRLTFTEPDAAMFDRALAKRAQLAAPIRTVVARAEALPFPAGAFDCVVTTLVLCSVRNVAVSLAEVARVLRPGGRLLFLEHTRAEGRQAVWQDRADRIWPIFALGCHPNRPTVVSIQEAGFRVTKLERHHPKGMPRLLQPAYVGIAINEGRSASADGVSAAFDKMEVQGGIV